MLITSALIAPTLPLAFGSDGSSARYRLGEALDPGGRRQPFEDDLLTMLTISELNADLCDRIIEHWLGLLDEHAPGATRHALRVTRHAVALASELGVPQAAWPNLQRGGLLHDVGKLFVPGYILRKRGKLTDPEWTSIREHPGRGCELIRSVALLEPSIEIIRSHHERWDGRGYPDGLAGEDIPLPARIFAVADVWDALTHDRPYRAAWPQDRAIELVRSEAGHHFDPVVVEAFLDTTSYRLAG